MKTCSTCKEVRPHSDYSKMTKAKDGLQNSCRPCQRVTKKRWNAENADRKRSYAYQYHYGITLEQYDEMLQAQGGVCAICQTNVESFGGRDRLVVDHDHATGAVRGLLCQLCNVGLGSFTDNLGRLEAAIQYLANHGGDKIPRRNESVVSTPQEGI